MTDSTSELSFSAHLVTIAEMMSSLQKQFDIEKAKVQDLQEENDQLKRLAGLSTWTEPWKPRRRRTGFLDLPGEMRNEIYRYVLVQDTPISTGISWSRSYFPVRDTYRLKGPQPAISRICRQVRLEALSVFYGENTFLFKAQSGMPALSERWRHVTKKYFKYLRSVTLETDRFGVRETSSSTIKVYVDKEDDNVNLEFGGDVKCACPLSFPEHRSEMHETAV